MMGVPSGRGYAIALVVFLVLAAVGFVLIWYGVGATITRVLRTIDHETAKVLGMIVGLAASIGWVMLLAALDDATATIYALGFFGLPAAAMFGARLARSAAAGD